MRRVSRVPFAVLVGFCSVCSGCGCPSAHGYKDWKAYRKAEVEARQKQAQPVIDALAKYHAARGAYPQQLKELVDGGFLDAVPDLASRLDHKGQPDRIESAEPLAYSPVGGEYRLVLEFRFAEKSRGSSMEEWGTSDEFVSEYRSNAKVWGPLRAPRRP